MPRTIQEILGHADELAKKFEESDPSDGTERPVSEYLLRRAALARARTERQIVEAVEAARVDGISLGEDRHASRHVGPSRPTTLRRYLRNSLT
jgi:hypothetical protein